MRTNIEKWLIGFVFSVLILSSCNWPGNTSAPQEEGKVGNLEGIPDSLKERLRTQDSLLSVFVVKIDSLTNGLNNAKHDIITLQNKIESLQSPGTILVFLALGGFILAVIAIIMCYVKTRNILSKAIIENYIESKIGNESYLTNIGNRLNKLERSVQSMDSSKSEGRLPISSVNSNIVEALNKRVTTLEAQIGSRSSSYGFSWETRSTDQGKSSVNDKEHTQVNPVGNKVCYANINNGPYFMQIFDSNQETCVYKITLTSQTTGNFGLLSLDKIRSSNYWQDAIEIETIGDCTIAEAQHFTPSGVGQCETSDGNMWKVTKKLRIKISK